MTRSIRLSRIAWSVGLALLLAAASPVAHAADAKAGLQGVVNVNTATLDELQILPGVGETRAKAILDTRRSRGGFKKVDELLEVKGIGETMLKRLRPFVVVQGKTTARIR